MKLNTVLTNLFKATILKVDLYDTGALYNSVEVFTNVVNDKLFIDIDCKDYVKYHLVETHLVDVFTSNQKFSNEISTLLKPQLETKISNSINNNVDFTFTPTITIYINGK
jgi:hypothetical protein